MNESPLFVLIYCIIGIYLGSLYYSDICSFKKGLSCPKALPGAKPINLFLIILSALVGLFLLINPVIGEYLLGIVESQKDMVWFFVFATLSAGIIEELVFRGYLVIENKGTKILLISCIGFSLLFAIIHPHLWEFHGFNHLSNEEGFTYFFFEYILSFKLFTELLPSAFSFNLTAESFYNTWILFLNSIIFYSLRFGPWNPGRSILPSMIAHAFLNLGVFVVKFFQGFVIF